MMKIEKTSSKRSKKRINGSIKNIKHINKQSAFSPNYMKNSVNLNMNDNEKDEYKNLRFSINNCLNEDIFNRQRLSSY